MKMQSLPARNRRRRIAPDVVEEEEEKEAAGGGADAKRWVPKPVGELQQYEYMDHTADVILHSWGTSLEQAIAQVCECFFSYMTDLDKIEIKTSFEVEATGHDMLDMLYHLLDE